MESSLVILIVCTFLSLLAMSASVGGAVVFKTQLYAFLASLNPFKSFTCANPPCKEGEGCLQGKGDCAAGLYCNISSKCVKKLANGESCPGVAAGSSCISGKCGTLSSCLDANGKAVLGAACSVVDQCGPGLWCGGVPIKCRPLGSVGDYCPLDSSKCRDGLYCDSTSKCAVPRPNGSGCFTDSACSSGNCYLNICVNKDSSLATGQTCSANRECANGACGKASADDGAGLVCCPSGDVTNYWGFDYCTKMPSGTTCWSDGMCASGNCKGNGGGIYRGKCT